MGSMSTRKVVLSQWTSLIKCSKCTSHYPAIRQFPAFPSVDSAHHNSYIGRRHYSSKTPVKSSLVPAPAVNTSIVQPPPPAVNAPVFSGQDIKEMDPETQLKIHNASTAVAKAQAASLSANTRIRRRKEILIMDESEYADKAILCKKGPLLDRRGEAQSFFLRAMGPDEVNTTDVMCTIQADIDLRPKAIKAWYERKQLEERKELQKYNPRRNKVLGSDLAAAHVVVARGGKVKFMGHKTWVTQYRKDAKPGVPEEDLPVMKFELCTLPINYDPRYRLEAIDASDVELHYEGLENFENLHYLKFLSLRNCPYIDDWCLDRLARQINETIEFIDLSGCKNVTDKGIGALHRCSKLKGIRLENMGHLENLEIVCAMLEDYNPNVEVFGIDYQARTEQLRLEGEEYEEKAKQLEAENVNLKAFLSLPGPKDEPGKATESNVLSGTAHSQ